MSRGRSVEVQGVVWVEMEGSDELEKRINAFLTQQFIGRKGLPADECLSEARQIIYMVREWDKRK